MTVRTIFDAVRIALAFKAQFPFVESDVDERLQALAYTVPPDGRTVMRISTDGKQSVGFRWKKGDCEVTYEPTRPFLSAEGKSPIDVAASFKDITDIANAILGVTFAKQLKWAELFASVRAIGGKQPLEALRGTDGNLTRELGKLAGHELQRYSFAVCSAHKGEESIPLTEIADWFQLALEPLVANPNFYHSFIVFRKPDAEGVRALAADVEATFVRLIERIEGS
jgi:hypothetical protein